MCSGVGARACLVFLLRSGHRDPSASPLAELSSSESAASSSIQHLSRRCWSSVPGNRGGLPRDKMMSMETPAGQEGLQVSSRDV